MMKALLSFFLLVACVYGAVVWAAWRYQHRLVFFPDPQIYATPKAIGLSFEDVTFETEDGIALHGWYVSTRKDNRKGTMLFFHGNAGNISHRLESIRLFNQMGLDVFIFDYRGYGQSEGTISEAGTYKDGKAAWRYLTEHKKINPQEIVLFGRSLGGGVVSELATQVNAKALILESTFTSTPDVGVKAYPLLPVRLLANIHYPNKERIDLIDMPILIIHSEGDGLIPYSHGQTLYELAGGKAKMLTIQGDHNNGFLTSGRVYTEGVYRFLEQFE